MRDRTDSPLESSAAAQQKQRRFNTLATLFSAGLLFFLSACDTAATPDVAPPQLVSAATGAVTLYLDCNFSGKSVQLDEGDYNYNDLIALGMPNDNVSSLRVADGYQAELFLDANYQGRSLNLTGDDNCLVDNNFNDLVSSVRVTRVGNTNPCNALTWTPNTNYQLGDVVIYPANGKFYKVVNVVAGGTDKTDPTISTWYWQPTTCEAPQPPTPPATCDALTWTAGVNYALGDVVLYPPNGRYYKVVNVTASGTEGTIPTISTYFWQPTECNPTPPNPDPPAPPTPPSGNGDKVVAAYYATFVGSVPRLKDIDPNYNLIYLFPATQAGGEPAGTLKFAAPPDGNGAWTNWAADMQLSRKQGRKFILSAGGAGQAIRFTDRNVSANFVNSVVEFYNAWGGFDGLDFNTFEADADPNTPEMIWVAKELKRRYPGFLITAPPAPWNKRDQKFCKDMLDAGAIDYCAPQYYDGPDLSDPAYLLENIKIWMDLMGPENVVVGFGVNNELNNYWKIDSVVDTFKTLEARYPNVKGVFDWRLDWDARDGYPFARRLGPLVTD